MKLVAIMSLADKRQSIRDLLKTQGVQIYSEIEIFGHTSATIAEHGWFVTAKEAPEYSTLCFAILPDDEAESVFTRIADLADADESRHPPRAFLVPVERMV